METYAEAEKSKGFTSPAANGVGGIMLSLRPADLGLSGGAWMRTRCSGFRGGAGPGPGMAMGKACEMLARMADGIERIPPAPPLLPLTEFSVPRRLEGRKLAQDTPWPWLWLWPWAWP